MALTLPLPWTGLDFTDLILASPKEQKHSRFLLSQQAPQSVLRANLNRIEKPIAIIRASSEVFKILNQSCHLAPRHGPMMHGEDRIHFQAFSLHRLHDFVHQLRIV